MNKCQGAMQLVCAKGTYALQFGVVQLVCAKGTQDYVMGAMQTGLFKKGHNHVGWGNADTKCKIATAVWKEGQQLQLEWCNLDMECCDGANMREQSLQFLKC